MLSNTGDRESGLGVQELPRSLLNLSVLWNYHRSFTKGWWGPSPCTMDGCGNPDSGVSSLFDDQDDVLQIHLSLLPMLLPWQLTNFLVELLWQLGCGRRHCMSAGLFGTCGSLAAILLLSALTIFCWVSCSASPYLDLSASDQELCV